MKWAIGDRCRHWWSGHEGVVECVSGQSHMSIRFDDGCVERRRRAAFEGEWHRYGRRGRAAFNKWSFAELYGDDWVEAQAWKL
jgi:hypothetical protein